MIQKLIELLRGWKVIVMWENQTFIHRANSFTDALGWAACYPINAKCAVYRGPRGEIVKECNSEELADKNQALTYIAHKRNFNHALHNTRQCPK